MEHECQRLVGEELGAQRIADVELGAGAGGRQLVLEAGHGGTQADQLVSLIGPARALDTQDEAGGVRQRGVAGIGAGHHQRARAGGGRFQRAQRAFGQFAEQEQEPRAGTG